MALLVKLLLSLVGTFTTQAFIEAVLRDLVNWSLNRLAARYPDTPFAAIAVDVENAFQAKDAPPPGTGA